MKYCSKAPLRIGLAGGGTDLPEFIKIKGGRVLNVTISLFTYCTIEENDSGKIIFNSTDLNILSEAPFNKKLTPNKDFRIYNTIHNYFFNKYNPHREINGYSLNTYSDVPKGSGLGGSSTLIVSIINCYAAFFNVHFDNYELAEIAFYIERDVLKIIGGSQDQYAAAFGGFNYIEFNKDQIVVNQLKLSSKMRNELQSTSVLYFTNIQREASLIEKEKNNIIKNNNNSIESLEEMKEFSTIMKNALLLGDFEKIINILNLGWDRKKSLSSAVSNYAIEKIIKKSFEFGALASKLSGAGGGGFIYFIVNLNRKKELIDFLNSSGGFVYNFDFYLKGSSNWKIKH
jgi:D-glycero-alpha-D-manno-heptose-7-phosphate kinase